MFKLSIVMDERDHIVSELVDVDDDSEYDDDSESDDSSDADLDNGSDGDDNMDDSDEEGGEESVLDDYNDMEVIEDSDDAEIILDVEMQNIMMTEHSFSSDEETDSDTDEKCSNPRPQGMLLSSSDKQKISHENVSD